MEQNALQIDNSHLAGSEMKQNEEVILSQFNIAFQKCLVNDSADRFKPMAEYLMNELCLVVRSETKEHHYRIVECEVYYHDPISHPDPYTHNRDEQASFGSWYFNDFGLDITIGKDYGDKKRNIYGGILIRSLYNQAENKYTHGPSLVLRELFSKFGSVFNRNTAIFLSKVNDAYSNANVYSAPRVNLHPKEEDYFNRHYRFVAAITPASKIPGKEALVRRLLEEALTEEDIRQIESMLNYKLKR